MSHDAYGITNEDAVRPSACEGSHFELSEPQRTGPTKADQLQGSCGLHPPRQLRIRLLDS
jgi:hypothetical protein|eukprot:COSAG02_NODE_2381_length_8995_cov_3.430980_3_plen_60_part_00